MRPEVTEELLAEAREIVDLFELEHGRPPDTLAELEESGRVWTVLDKETGISRWSPPRLNPKMTLENLNGNLFAVYGWNIIYAIAESQGAEFEYRFARPPS
jgi:hypothetical protein